MERMVTDDKHIYIISSPSRYRCCSFVGDRVARHLNIMVYSADRPRLNWGRPTGQIATFLKYSTNEAVQAAELTHGRRITCQDWWQTRLKMGRQRKLNLEKHIIESMRHASPFSDELEDKVDTLIVQLNIENKRISVFLGQEMPLFKEVSWNLL